MPGPPISWGRGEEMHFPLGFPFIQDEDATPVHLKTKSQGHSLWTSGTWCFSSAFSRNDSSCLSIYPDILSKSPYCSEFHFPHLKGTVLYFVTLRKGLTCSSVLPSMIYLPLTVETHAVPWLSGLDCVPKVQSKFC